MVETTGPAAASAAQEEALRALRSAEDAVNAWLDLAQAEAEARGGDPLRDQAYRAGLRLWSVLVAAGGDFATRSAAAEAGEGR
ncbi:hypothetical protein LY13_003998 [Prauserella aidingensis]|nr:hypothetical protein [Prauserella aidingensis]